MRAASGLWISPGERRRGPAGWWRSGRLAMGTSIHLSIPLSPAMEALTGAPPPRLVRAVVFSGDGGLPGLPGPLTFPERRPLISAVAERPTPRRIPQRAAGRRCGRLADQVSDFIFLQKIFHKIFSSDFFILDAKKFYPRPFFLLWMQKIIYPTFFCFECKNFLVKF